MKENIRHVLLRVETVTRDEEGKEEQIPLQVPGTSRSQGWSPVYSV